MAWAFWQWRRAVAQSGRPRPTAALQFVASLPSFGHGLECKCAWRLVVKGHPMRQIMTALVLLGLAASVSACACRPGHIGPYGGIHPARCVVY